MDYGKILFRAWQIFWKYKILWVFGILASCSSRGSSPNFNYSFSRGNFGDFSPGEMPHFHFFYRFFDLTEYYWGLIFLALFLLALLIGFIFFLISTYGQVGLIRGIRKAEVEKPEKLTFKEITAETRPFYWRLAGLKLLIFFGIMAVVILFVLFMMVFSMITLGIGALLILPLLCLFIPVMAVVSIILGQAAIAMVVEDLSISDALSRGWQVVSKNWVVYLVMGLILMIIGVIYSLITSAPVFVAIAPLFWTIFTAGPYEELGDLFLNFLRSTTIWFMIAYWPVLIVLQGLLMTFTNSAWVLTFLEVTGNSEQEAGEGEPESDPPDPESESEPA
jgi:hypothetical protein